MLITRCKTPQERELRKREARKRYYLRNKDKIKEYNRLYYLKKKNKSNLQKDIQND